MTIQELSTSECLSENLKKRLRQLPRLFPSNRTWRHPHANTILISRRSRIHWSPMSLRHRRTFAVCVRQSHWLQEVLQSGKLFAYYGVLVCKDLNTDKQKNDICGPTLPGSVLVILNEASQTKVSHLAHQIVPHEDVCRSEVSVHIVHPLHVRHPRGDLRRTQVELTHWWHSNADLWWRLEQSRIPTWDAMSTSCGRRSILPMSPFRKSSRLPVDAISTWSLGRDSQFDSGCCVKQFLLFWQSSFAQPRFHFCQTWALAHLQTSTWRQLNLNSRFLSPSILLKQEVHRANLVPCTLWRCRSVPQTPRRRAGPASRVSVSSWPELPAERPLATSCRVSKSLLQRASYRSTFLVRHQLKDRWRMAHTADIAYDIFLWTFLKQHFVTFTHKSCF